MNEIKLDTAIKFGAGRYRQGPDILEHSGEEVARFGKHVFIIAGPRSFAASKDRLLPSLDAAGVSYVIRHYTGTCCMEDARVFAGICQENHCDEVIGLGGGRIMDFSKVVGEIAGCGVINIPTSMSTCAPFTCMSVIYTPEGAKEGYHRYEHELDAVLADTTVIANCPIRYNAAGVLDAMAKKIEIMNGRPALDLDTTGIDLFSAYNIAAYAYDVLVEYGPQAIEDNRHHRVTKALEDVCFVNIALTGVIANITRSFRQSALAHLFYDGIRTHFYLESRDALHGEIVAVGLFIQLYYNRLSDQEARLREFMKGLDMKLTMDECGVPSTDENLAILEAYMIDSPHVDPTEENLKYLHEAMKRVRPS